tara:strand:- start:36234 stop:37196 length:963 start_codon:yes stop_codon:yes gene_type:complete
MIRRLHRDRRRIAVLFALLFGAGVVETWNKSDLFPPGVMEVGAGIGLLVFVGTFLIAAGLALPSLRHAYTPIGLTLFGAAVLGRVFPGSAFSLLTITEGGARSIAGLITTGLFVHFLFYGRWSDKLLTMRRSRNTTRLTTIKLESDTLWHGFVPTPGRREMLHDPDVLSVDWVDRERSRVRIIRWAPPAKKIEEFHQIEDYLPGAYIVYRWVRQDEERKERLLRGLRAVKMIDLVDRRVIYITEFNHNRPLRKVLFDWIDDSLGRIEDERLAQLESAAGSTKSKEAARRESLAVGGVLRPKGQGDERLRPRPPLMASAAE